MSRKIWATMKRRSWESTSRERYKWSSLQLLPFWTTQEGKFSLLNYAWWPIHTGLRLERSDLQTVIWVVTLCTGVSGYIAFGGTFWLRLQGWRVQNEECRSRSYFTNIRMELVEVGWGDVDWIGLAQDMDRWRALVNSVLNLRIP
jgi:hypothetical protein